MSRLYIPESYRNLLQTRSNTEKAIKFVKDSFEKNLSAQLSLLRVTAPMVVMKGIGLNDDLSGVERPVSFPIKDMGNAPAEVVHSLAKWKRMKLSEMQIEPGRGLYTDMNALRPDEELDNLHSIYVDQWDWEQVINPAERGVKLLEKTVIRIYEAIRMTENLVALEYPEIPARLPETIHFIHAQQLLDMYPGLSSKERENRIVKEKKAVFIIGIGCPLSDGKPHDLRAADYDDWSSPCDGYCSADGKKLVGLNGDLLVWNDILDCAFELSSMGIRVNPFSLDYQLNQYDQNHKRELLYHKTLLSGGYLDTIGGGIGQSRLCMLLLRKAHVGEVQASLWPEDMREKCAEKGVELL